MKPWTMMGCGLIALLPGSSVALAQETTVPDQFVLVDAHQYSHSSWYKFWKFPWQPNDWTQPVDYSRGVTYFRYDIRSLRERVMLQFCYFQDKHVSEKHACGPQWTFDEPGIYYRRISNRDLWQRQVIDWSRELLDFMLIDNASEGRARASVEVTILVVGEGKQLVAPENWQCPADWDCAGDASGNPEPEPPEPEPNPEPPEPPEPEPEPNPEPPEPPEPEPEPEPDPEPEPLPTPDPDPEPETDPDSGAPNPHNEQGAGDESEPLRPGPGETSTGACAFRNTADHGRLSAYTAGLLISALLLFRRRRAARSA